MAISEKPRFKLANDVAQELLINSILEEGFPFSATHLVEENIGITCWSFGKVKSKFKFNPKDLGSDSAILLKIANRPIIFYNEKHPKPRIKYSILHELAHILLNHIETKDCELYEKQEIEANFLVAQLLMPDAIIEEFIRRGKVISEDFLMKTFGVSREAAKKKRLTLEKKLHFNFGVYSEFEEWLLIKYKGFIDTVAPSALTSLDWADIDNEEEMERDNWR